MPAIRILTVDGAYYWRKFVAFMLRVEPDFQIVCEAADGFRAVQLARQMQPTVALLDIGLPGLCGLETGKQIRLLSPATKIVYVSQEEDTDVVGAALEMGASGYVLKYDAAKELVPAIRAALRDETFISRGLLPDN
jgi:DNA-binding NarL/FixJ family response regulator